MAFKAFFQDLVMMAVGLVSAVIREQTIGQAVGGAVLDDTVAAVAVIGTACLGAQAVGAAAGGGGHEDHLAFCRSSAASSTVRTRPVLTTVPLMARAGVLITP